MCSHRISHVHRVGLLAAALLLAGLLVLGCFLLGMWQGQRQAQAFWKPRIQEWSAEVSSLELQLAEAKQAALPDAEDPALQKRRESLLARTDLLGEGVLGGTMAFFPEELRFFGQDLAYAYAEDGHVALELLLQYQPFDDSWTVLAHCQNGGEWVSGEG